MTYPILARATEPREPPRKDEPDDELLVLRAVVAALQTLDRRLDGVEARHREPTDDEVFGLLGAALKALDARLDGVEGVIKHEVRTKLRSLEQHNRPRARYRPTQRHDPELLDRVRELQDKLKQFNDDMQWLAASRAALHQADLEAGTTDNSSMIQLLYQQGDAAADFHRAALDDLRELWREHRGSLGDW
jgi:predicted transcriptional regulator